MTHTHVQVPEGMCIVRTQLRHRATTMCFQGWRALYLAEYIQPTARVVFLVCISAQEDFGSAGCHGNMRGPLSANINRRFKLVRVDRVATGTRCLPGGKKLGAGIPLENIRPTLCWITYTDIRCQSSPSGYRNILCHGIERSIIFFILN